MALKETKAGPRSSGTPVIVYNRNNLDFLSKLPPQILTELSKNVQCNLYIPDTVQTGILSIP